MKLNDQLNQVTQAALLVISERIKADNGVVTLFEDDRVVDDELTDHFLNSVPELNHYLGDFEGNTIMYPFLINGDKHNAFLFCIDEQGTEHTVDLFEMDANNITLIADHITENL